MAGETEAANPTRSDRPESHEYEVEQRRALLPALIPSPEPALPPRRWWRLVALLLLLGAGGLGGLYWWQHSQNGLPPGFASGNGRLEADEIDIATKFAGRVAEILADEGDIVKPGQAVSRMDTSDLAASLAKAEAQVLQAQKTLESTRSLLEQQRAQMRLARQELDRARTLVQKGYETKEVVDQRQTQLEASSAMFDAAQAQIGQMEHALEAVRQDAALIRVNIADNTLIAPKDGRIQYRLANVGEVLPAGGKVFTMLDTGYVYMDVFLPTAEAGRVALGSEARIVLDALPKVPIPATVSFLSTQAQFTPKTVETKEERDKLMFRVRVRIDPGLLRAHAEEVRSGLPGVAYIRLDPKVEWPEFLHSRPSA